MIEVICDVYWEGPFHWHEMAAYYRPHHVLYSIHGTHPLYGRDVLLYIGMTGVGVAARLPQHEDWVSEESDSMTVKLASIGKFDSAEAWRTFYGSSSDEDVYAPPAESIVRAVEALLIYAHQPAYNSSGKSGGNIMPGLRIFHTGRFGLLLPELSWDYYG